MGEADNRFDKKMREEKPGGPFVSAVFCFKTSDSAWKGVACHTPASHNKIPLTLAHVPKVNVITLKADLKKKKKKVNGMCKLVNH